MNAIEYAKRDFRKILVFMGIFSLFVNLLMLTIPLYMLQIYDRVLPSQSGNTLLFLSLIAALALVVLGALEIVRTIIAGRAAARLDVHVSGDALRNVIRLGHHTNGDTQLMRDLQSVRSLISSRQIFGLLDLPFAPLFIGLLYLIHPDLFWLTIAGAVVLVLLAIVNQRFSAKPGNAATGHMIAASSKADSLARNSETLIAMGMVENVVGYWARENLASLVAADRSTKLNAVFSGMSRIVRLGLQVGILGYGAILVLSGEMTAGMIFASSIISGRGLQPIDQVINSWRQLAGGWSAWGRFSNVMAKIQRHDGRTELGVPKGDVAFEQVTMPNPADAGANPILSKINFALPAGQSMAMIGPSGSGKSTIARLAVGAIQPRFGTVRIDGHDIANWDRELLGNHIGYLSQEVELLPGTVAQNIARFYPSASDQQIVEAARRAHVEDLIQRLPHGYDTQLGSAGIQLSGGERQRIALARAFFGGPRLMVLDEPNANLDRFGEEALLKALIEARRDQITVILITQREPALAVMDRIMRIQAGIILDYDEREAIVRKFRRPPDGQAKPGPGGAPLPSQSASKPSVGGGMGRWPQKPTDGKPKARS